MTNRILTNDGWEKRIQDKLGVDPAYLSNDAINQRDVINIAEANIIAQIPEYATLEDDLKIYLEYAVVLECCILLCSSMSARLPKKETGPHTSHELGIDWDKKKIGFEEEKEMYIMKIIDTLFPNTPSSLPFFIITSPKKEWLD